MKNAKCPSLRSGYLEGFNEVSREKSRGKLKNGIYDERVN